MKIRIPMFCGSVPSDLTDAFRQVGGSVPMIARRVHDGTERRAVRPYVLTPPWLDLGRDPDALAGRGRDAT